MKLRYFSKISGCRMWRNSANTIIWFAKTVHMVSILQLRTYFCVWSPEILSGSSLGVMITAPLHYYLGVYVKLTELEQNKNKRLDMHLLRFIVGISWLNDKCFLKALTETFWEFSIFDVEVAGLVGHYFSIHQGMFIPNFGSVRLFM